MIKAGQALGDELPAPAFDTVAITRARAGSRAANR